MQKLITTNEKKCHQVKTSTSTNAGFKENLSSKRQRADTSDTKGQCASIENAVECFVQRFKALLKDCMVQSGIEKNNAIENNPIFVVLVSRAWELDTKHIEWAQHKNANYLKK